jgi:hypothetical protein
MTLQEGEIMTRRLFTVTSDDMEEVEITMSEEEQQAYQEWFKRTEHLWCDCDEPEFGTYPEDGQCPCGQHKHHVHCAICGKILQVG